MSARAFSLIEILVVIGLFALTTFIVTAAYSSFERNQRLKNAASALKNDIRFMQNKALAGDKAGCPATSTLGGWYLELIGGSSSYRLSGDCLAGSVETDFGSITKTLPTNMRIFRIDYGTNTYLTEVNVFFRSLAHDVNVYGTQSSPDFFTTDSPPKPQPSIYTTPSDLLIDLVSTGTSDTYRIIVRPSGEVNEYKL